MQILPKERFDIVLSKVDNPKGKWNKLYPGTRNLKGFALPMILCNLSLEIEHLLDDKFLMSTIDTCIHEVMEVVLPPGVGRYYCRNVLASGELSDSI